MPGAYVSLLYVVPLVQYLAFFFCTQSAINKRVICGGTRFLLAVCCWGVRLWVSVLCLETNLIEQT